MQHGPDKEVFFPQDWEAGRARQLDWTNANELAVTIAGQPYEHLLCHCVLPHSNWDWATRCLSESLLSCRQGLQEALHRMGKVPRQLRVDNSSAASCGKPTCRCVTEGILHGPYYQWTRKLSGKTVNLNLDEEAAKMVQEWIQNSRKLRKLCRRLEKTSLAVLQLGTSMRKT